MPLNQAEAVDILTSGPNAGKEWNARRLREDSLPSLSGISLYNKPILGADLSACDLKGARCDLTNFSRSTFSNADLSNTSLVSAKFEQSILHNTILRSARLNETLFVESDLSDAIFDNSSGSWTGFRGCIMNRTSIQDCHFAGASFEDSILVNAIFRNSVLKQNPHQTGYGSFRNTILSNCDFSGSRLLYMPFGDTLIASDLSGVGGLETSYHFGPSRITFQTLRNLRGSLDGPGQPETSTGFWPIKFLRGCGLSNLEIETITAIVGSPIQYYSAFISYSSKDDAFAIKLHDALQARDVRCWLDTHAVLIGDNIHRAVNDGIRLWDKVLLCCSKASLTSWWVKDEVTRAVEKEQRLEKERGKEVLAMIPLDLDGYLFAPECDFEYGPMLRKRHAANFRSWQTDEHMFDSEVVRLLQALRADDGARAKPPKSLL